MASDLNPPFPDSAVAGPAAAVSLAGGARHRRLYVIAAPALHMRRGLSRRQLLASGGTLFAGGLLASATEASATGADSAAVDPPPVRWAETYDQAGTDTVQDALRTNDGNYVVAGQSGADRESVQPWVFSIDARGGRRWQRPVETDEVAGFNTVVEAGDGYLLGGYRGRAADGQEAIAVRLDADREVQWQRAVESPRQGGNIVSLVPADEDRYVGVGLARGEEPLDVSAWAFELDSEGARQWSETFAPRYTNYVASVEPTGDGEYVLGGAVRAEPTEDDQRPPFIGWLLTVDGEGSRQWSETYRESTDGSDHQLNFFYDVLATDDGYLAVGNTAVELLGGQRGWVLSVGTSGERQAQLRTRPADMDVGQFQRVRPFEDGYALVGVGQPSTADAASVWMAGIDDELTEQWSGTEQYVDGSQGVTALVTDDDGLLVFGNVNVEGGRLTTDALALKAGGDPVPTGTPTAAETAEPTPTPSPTPSATPTATATPTETATPTDPSPTPDTGTTADDGPGFGVGTTLAALGSGAVLRRFVRSDDAPSDE